MSQNKVLEVLYFANVLVVILVVYNHDCIAYSPPFVHQNFKKLKSKSNKNAQNSYSSILIAQAAIVPDSSAPQSRPGIQISN